MACAPNTSLNPVTCACEPIIVCDPGPDCYTNPLKVWLPYPKCNCACSPKLPACPNGEPRDEITCECKKNVCDPPGPCPPNQIWYGFPTCKCDCPVSLKCDNKLFYYDPKTCQCECKNPPKCKPNQVLSKKDCKCYCREPCQDCSKPQVWQSSSCDCRCPSAQKCDPLLRYWDEQSCSCRCWTKERKCCANKIWDDKVRPGWFLIPNNPWNSPEMWLPLQIYVQMCTRFRVGSLHLQLCLC